MNAIYESIERHHRPIIFSLKFIVVFFGASCTFHDDIAIFHYVFGCGQKMHLTKSH